MGEFDARPSPPTLGQKLGGAILVALAVAILGAGLNTWRIADANRAAILRLERSVEREERYSSRDCQRIERMVIESIQDLDSHDHSPAHREAEIRLKNLESWREKRRPKPSD